MEEISLAQAMNPLNEVGLKDLRDNNNIVLPQEYINSTKNLSIALSIWTLICGFFIGFGLNEII